MCALDIMTVKMQTAHTHQVSFQGVKGIKDANLPSLYTGCVPFPRLGAGYWSFCPQSLWLCELPLSHLCLPLICPASLCISAPKAENFAS